MKKKKIKKEKKKRNKKKKKKLQRPNPDFRLHQSPRGPGASPFFSAYLLFKKGTTFFSKLCYCVYQG